MSERSGAYCLYVCGPMSGLPQFNAPAFRHAAGALRDRGYRVLSPVEFDEAEGFDHSGSLTEEQYLSFLRRDLLRILEADVDGAVALDGWDNSRGAALEVAVLRGLAKPIYRLPADPLADLEPVAEQTKHRPFKGQHPMSGRFYATLNELGELHAKKQQDYGRDDDPFANVRASNEWGVPEWVGAMVRATDKVRRLQTFARKGTLANEGVRDAFMDLAVYAVIALVLFEEATAPDREAVRECKDESCVESSCPRCF